MERIDALFAIEREIIGRPPHERQRVRNERSQPLVIALEAWLREQRSKPSGRSETAKAIVNEPTALFQARVTGCFCENDLRPPIDPGPFADVAWDDVTSWVCQ